MISESLESDKDKAGVRSSDVPPEDIDSVGVAATRGVEMEKVHRGREERDGREGLALIDGQLDEIVTPEEVLSRIPPDSDVVIIGEGHGTTETPKMMTGMLAGLKEKGYDTLALEVEAKYQPYYDQYMKGELTIDQLAAKAPICKFKKEKGGVSPEGAALLEEAKRLGFSLVCVDNWEGEEVRDYYMAEGIHQLYKSGKKVVFYVGKKHGSKQLEKAPLEKTLEASKVDDKMTGYRLVERGLKVTSLVFYELHPIHEVMGITETEDDPQDEVRYDDVFKL